jgi:hypothetical protein
MEVLRRVSSLRSDPVRVYLVSHYFNMALTRLYSIATKTSYQDLDSPAITQIRVDPMTILTSFQPHCPDIRSSSISKIPMARFPTFSKPTVKFFNNSLS